MKNPQTRPMLYCEVCGHQCVCEVGYENNFDCRNKKKKWIKMTAEEALRRTKTHERLYEQRKIDMVD